MQSRIPRDVGFHHSCCAGPLCSNKIDLIEERGGGFVFSPYLPPLIIAEAMDWTPTAEAPSTKLDMYVGSCEVMSLVICLVKQGSEPLGPTIGAACVAAPRCGLSSTESVTEPTSTEPMEVD